MVEITPENFDEYFFDARRHKPKKGQVLAKFAAVAEFVGGKGKKDIIALLKMDKAYQAVQVMKKIHGAKEPDCYKVCRMIIEDLLEMSEKAVEEKPYQFVVEYYFYTERELIPKNNKHWEVLPLLQCDEQGNIKSTIYL